MKGPKPKLQRVGGRWAASAMDPRGVRHEATGETFNDALAVLSRSYQLPSGLAGEVAAADPFRLIPAPDTPYNPSVLVQRRGLRIFDEMRRDDQVKAALSFKKHAVFAAGWAVDVPEGMPEDWEPAVYVQETLEALEGHFTAELLEILSALDYGYSVTEKIFEERDGLLTLVALKTRAPHAFDFAIDEFGNLLPNGVLQWSHKGGQRELPAEKFVIFRNMAEFGNPYGTSDLEAAYRPWWFKDNAYKWLGMLLERYGIPPILLKYKHGSLNAQQIDELKNILKNLQASTAAIIPFGEDPGDVELWSPQLAGQVSTAFNPAINMYNTDIARAVLMPGLLGLTPEATVGSQARARVVFDVFMFVRDFLSDILAELVTERIIRPIIELNFPISRDEIPRFRLLPIDDNLQKELFDSWVSLVGAKVVNRQASDEEHIRQLLRFPVMEEGEQDDDEDDEEPENPEPDPAQDDEEVEERSDREDLSQVYASEREMAEIERQIDVPAIVRELDDLEAKALSDLRSIPSTIEEALARKVQTRGIAVPLSLTATQKGLLREFIERMMASAFTAGAKRAAQELPRANEEAITLLGPAEVLAFLADRAFFISGITEERILARARHALYLSLKHGETTQAAVERLRIAVGDVLSAPQLETIVRTNTTEAYNLGRLNRIQRSPFVKQVAFSAILDTRTTEVCRFMHGKIFRRDDPALARLLPPLHFNCRSVVVPVPPSMERDPSELITEAQKGKGIGLAGEGFA